MTRLIPHPAEKPGQSSLDRAKAGQAIPPCAETARLASRVAAASLAAVLLVVVFAGTAAVVAVARQPPLVTKAIGGLAILLPVVLAAIARCAGGHASA